jgi:hypothetical protein
MIGLEKLVEAGAIQILRSGKEFRLEVEVLQFFNVHFN